MDLWVAQPVDTAESNSGMVYVGNSGSDTFDTTGVLIRVGQGYDGTVDSNCWFRNVQIWPWEVTP
jgi:hypothetical protein